MSLLAVIALAAHTTAAAIHTPPPEVRGDSLMRALRAGGYTILQRHARTDHSVQEPMGAPPTERSQQRNLSDDGVRDAHRMGVVLRKYGIPIGEIVSSPMYRARETAEMAAGTPRLTMALRAYPSTDEQAALVAAAPAPGTNRLLVTHHFVIETHVPGIRPGDVQESEAAVVRPTGDGKVVLVGRITLGDWERLAGEPTATAAAPVVTNVEIPDSPVGRLARRYLDAVNSGDTTRMRAFIESSLTPNPDRPTAVRVAAFVQTHDRFGALAVTGIDSTTASEGVFRVRANGDDYQLTVRVSPDQPQRAASIVLATRGAGHP